MVLTSTGALYVSQGPGSVHFEVFAKSQVGGRGSVGVGSKMDLRGFAGLFGIRIM